MFGSGTFAFTRCLGALLWARFVAASEVNLWW